MKDIQNIGLIEQLLMKVELKYCVFLKKLQYQLVLSIHILRHQLMYKKGLQYQIVLALMENSTLIQKQQRQLVLLLKHKLQIIFQIYCRLDIVFFQIQKRPLLPLIFFVTGDGGATFGQYTIPALKNSFLFYPFSGFSWDALAPLIIQNGASYSSGNFQVTYKTSSGSYIRSLTFQGVILFSKILFPFYVQSYRITKQWDDPSTSLMQVTFVEQNKIYNTVKQESFIVSYTQQQINVIIEIILQKGYKIEGFFLKCNECGDNNKYTTKQIYYSQTNYIKFTIKLYQYTDADASIKINLSTSKILIQQINVNQVVSYYDIIQLEILPDI